MKYISTTGNDSSSGDSGAPWRTLVYATSHTTAGDMIHVNAGTFTEVEQSSLAAAVNLEGEGATSVIKAGYASNPLLSLLSASEGIDGSQSVSNLKFDGNALTGSRAIYVRGRSNVSIHDITVADFSNAGVVWTGRGDDAQSAPSTFALGNQFYSNTVTNSSEYTSVGYGALMIGCASPLSRRCTNDHTSRTKRIPILVG